jgi:hypothetical protein
MLILMKYVLSRKRLGIGTILVLASLGASQEKWIQVPPDALSAGPHHTRHVELFGKLAPDGFNQNVLRAIDTVQATAMDGGEYYIHKKDGPTESPIGYELKLFSKSLLSPPRKSSYCSGASYTAFIETLNLQFPDGNQKISPERFEALRMQEPDGGRREDGIKFWGLWNDDGPGSQEAALQYANMAIDVKPADARPGDFMNINWKSGVGHSVIFLGYHTDSAGIKYLRYWSSQTGTNGLGDQSSALSKVKSVKIIRIVHPENVFTFDPATAVKRRGIAYDKIDW